MTAPECVLLGLIALLGVQVVLLDRSRHRFRRALRLHEKILRELVHRSEIEYSHPDDQETPCPR